MKRTLLIAAVVSTACGDGGLVRVADPNLRESQGPFGTRFENAISFAGERPGRSTYDGFQSVPNYEEIVARCTAACSGIVTCFEGSQRSVPQCAVDCVNETLAQHLACALPSLEAIECLVESLCVEAGLFLPGND